MKSLLGVILALFLTPVSASEIGASAIEFLMKVKSGSLNLKPSTDSALIEQTTAEKSSLIAQHIKKLSADLKGAELEIGSIKQDNEFAAVLIKKSSGTFSSNPSIIPIALVRSGTDWKAAPIPASFENTVLGYTLPIRDRLFALESWMSSTRVTELNQWQTECAKRTKKIIRSRINEESLIGDDIGAIEESFISSMKSRDRVAILGYMGGLQDTLPSDWDIRLRASKKITQKNFTNTEPWRTFVSPQVIQVKVAEELRENSGKVTYVCLDPLLAGKSGSIAQYRLFHLHFTRNQGELWTIHLPGPLLHGEIPGEEFFDTDLLNLFPAKIREMNTASFAETADLASQNLFKNLRSKNVRAVIQQTDLGSSPKNGRIACGEAVETWWSLHEPNKSHHLIELGFRQEGDLAVAVYQWFSLKEPADFRTRSFYFIKSKEGWLWSPGVFSKEHKKSHELLSEWQKSAQSEWRDSWKNKLLSTSVQLKEVTNAFKASDDEVKILVSKWLSALKARDLSAALSSSAWWHTENCLPLKTLRNLNYEFTTEPDIQSEISSIYRSPSWVAVSVRHIADQKISFSFLPIVSTAHGNRFFPEIDLRFNTSPTRNFLNEASFKHIGLVCNPEKTRELRELFIEFCEKSQQSLPQ